MGKMLKKGCMAALAGGMVFGIFGGGCLGAGMKFAGQGLAEGGGWAMGRDFTRAWITDPVTVNQRAINQVDFNEAVAEEIKKRQD